MSMFFNPFKRKTPTPINLSLDQIDKARREFMTDYEKQPFKLSDSFPKALTRLSPAPLNENKIAEEAYKSKFGSYRNSQIEKAGLASRLVDKLSTKLAGHKGDVLIIAQKEGDEEPEATLPQGIKAEDLLEQIEEVYREAQLDPHAGPRSGSYEKLQSRLKENNLQIHSNNAEPSLSFITALLQQASGEYQKPEGGPNTAQNDKTHHADARTIKTAVDEARAAAEAPPAAPADNPAIVRNLNDLSMFEALKMVEELYQDVALSVQIVVPVKKGIGEDPSVHLLKHVSTLQSLNTTSDTEGEKRKKVTVTLLKRDGQFFPISEMGNLFSPDRHPEARRDAKNGFLRKYTSKWATSRDPHRAYAHGLTDHLLEERRKNLTGGDPLKPALDKEYKKRTSTGKINEKDGLFFGILKRATKLKERNCIENLKAESNVKNLQTLFSNTDLQSETFYTRFKEIMKGELLRNVAAPPAGNAMPVAPETRNALLRVLEQAQHDDRISKNKKRIIAKALKELKIVEPYTYDAPIQHPLAKSENQTKLVYEFSHLCRLLDSPENREKKKILDEALELIHRAFFKSDDSDLRNAQVMLDQLLPHVIGLEIGHENIANKIDDLKKDIADILAPKDSIPSSDPLMKKYCLQIFEQVLSKSAAPESLRESIKKYENFSVETQQRALEIHETSIRDDLAKIDGIQDLDKRGDLQKEVDRLEMTVNGILNGDSRGDGRDEILRTFCANFKNIKMRTQHASDLRKDIERFTSFKPFDTSVTTLQEELIAEFLVDFGKSKEPELDPNVPPLPPVDTAPARPLIAAKSAIAAATADSAAIAAAVAVAHAKAAEHIARTNAHTATGTTNHTYLQVSSALIRFNPFADQTIAKTVETWHEAVTIEKERLATLQAAIIASANAATVAADANAAAIQAAINANPAPAPNQGGRANPPAPANPAAPANPVPPANQAAAGANLLNTAETLASHADAASVRYTGEVARRARETTQAYQAARNGNASLLNLESETAADVASASHAASRAAAAAQQAGRKAVAASNHAKENLADPDRKREAREEAAIARYAAAAARAAREAAISAASASVNAASLSDRETAVNERIKANCHATAAEEAARYIADAAKTARPGAGGAQ